MKKNKKTIFVITAHDDDFLLAIGGISLLRHKNDEIHQLVCTSCENSHRLVLGEVDDPTPNQVMEARRHESQICNQILKDVGLCIVYEQWGIPEACSFLPNNMDEVKWRIKERIRMLKPDVVYFHSLDGHEDHKAIHNATKLALKEIDFTGEMYTFAIWTKQVAQENPELDEADIPDFDENCEIVNIHSVLSIKEKALNAFKSQVEANPYAEWKPQARSILLPNFKEYFLRGEEVITPFLWK